MAGKFETTYEYGDGHTYLRIGGVIDEDNGLAGLTNNVRGTTLILDLSGVDRINSCGVRDWVNWQQQVSATGVHIVLIRCSPAIIHQVNMVTNFIGDATIHSFFAPYFNPETDEEKSILLYSKDLYGQRPVRAPKVFCPDTGYELEFDDFEESYFAFAAGASSSAAPDSGLSQLLERYTPELSENNATSDARTTKMSSKSLSAQVDAVLAERGQAGFSMNPNATFQSDDTTSPQPAPMDTAASLPTQPGLPSTRGRIEAQLPRAPANPALQSPHQSSSGSGPSTVPTPAPNFAAPQPDPLSMSGLPTPATQSRFVTNPNAATPADSPPLLADPIEADSSSSVLIIGGLGVVLIVVLVLLLWLVL